MNPPPGATEYPLRQATGWSGNHKWSMRRFFLHALSWRGSLPPSPLSNPCCRQHRVGQPKRQAESALPHCLDWRRKIELPSIRSVIEILLSIRRLSSKSILMEPPPVLLKLIEVSMRFDAVASGEHLHVLRGITLE